MTNRRRRQLPSGTGYPRICGECGQPFLAKRTTARWCSDKCRLRAWRHSTRRQDRREIEQLREQVQQLQTALQQIQDGNLCATAGCQIANQPPSNPPGRPSAQHSGSPPWRSAEWNDQQVRRLRSRLTETTQELDRLRTENVVMRRWIQERLKVDDTGQSRREEQRDGPAGDAR